MLDVHRDADHHRAVFTLAGAPGDMAEAVLAGAREAVARIDLRTHEGVHPRVGVLDVAPIVFPTPDLRGAACAEALVLADLLGRELELPVHLYGLLGDGRTRAELRAGGVNQRDPDFGPPGLHPTAGATLVAARPALVAFNLLLAPTVSLARARDVAGELRSLPGLRALGLQLERGAQLSFNVEEPERLPLAAVVAAARDHVDVVEAELVGLAPEAAFEGFPADLPIPGFDPSRHLIERVIS